ncbi:MAG: NAD-dependent epimerase/dehydratase family protein [Candidatus Nanohaloarchaea archaeon]
MKIYVTGGTGFVGSHLTRKLLEQDHEVTVGGLNPENSVLELPEEIGREGIDVTDPASLDFEGYDCVIHLVALSPLRKPPASYREVHVEGTRNVVEEAERSGVDKLVHVSAIGADPEAETEYLRTKGKAQEIVEESELSWRIFRPSIMFGEGGEFMEFVSKLATPFFTVQPGRDTLFQPLYVEDMVEMVEGSLQDKYNGKVFEVGGPEKLSLGNIVSMVKRSEGKPVMVAKLPDTFFRLGMEVSERIPVSPFGMDQYRSLQSQNIVENNDAERLGKKESELKTLREYLEV